MNILYLAHRIPYPPNKGDKIRSFNEIKYLAENHSVDLICLADDPEDLQYKEALLKYCRKVFVQSISPLASKIRGIVGFCCGKSISVAYFYRQAVQNSCNQWLETGNYDAVICFSSSMAEYIFKSNLFMLAGLNNVQERPKLIMDFCDVDSDKWLQYSEKASFPVKQIYEAENIRLQEYERLVCQAFDASVLVSEQEKLLFLKICPEDKKLAVIPNGVDATYFSPDLGLKLPEQNKGPALVFTGAMDYHANIDGVCWFCREIFPLLIKEFPDLQFYVVGRNPPQVVRNLEILQNVHVVGDVADIRPWYQKADVFVVPLRLARGVQNKVLEAMAMGRAVVSTSKANAGIRAVHEKDVIIADFPEEFATAISDLYRDIEKRKQLEGNARQFVITNYDWKKNMKVFDNLLA